MDLEDQGRIKSFVDEHSKEQVVVVLGSPTAESAGLYAETLTSGDPTYSGPLAGVSLGLPVYHILEPSVKAQIPPDVYQEQVGLMETVLEAEEIIRQMARIRGQWNE